jgi:hypothetical protein
MDVKLGYAIAGGIAGFIPGGTFVLLVLEGFMFYHICHRYKVPVLEEGFGFVIAIAGVSLILKFAVETLHSFLGCGQIINAIVAFGVVYGLAHVVDNYARRRVGEK